MTKSNLPVPKLKEIWIASAQTNSNYLTKYEFFLALRLIAYAQNNIPITPETILSTVPVTLPNIEGYNIKTKEEIEDNTFILTESEIAKFTTLFNKNKDSNSMISMPKLKIMLENHHIEPKMYNTLINLIEFSGSLIDFIALIKMINVLIAHPNNSISGLPKPIAEFLKKDREPIKVETVKVELVKVEPVKAEPVKVELVKEAERKRSEPNIRYEEVAEELDQPVAFENDLVFMNVLAKLFQKAETLIKTSQGDVNELVDTIEQVKKLAQTIEDLQKENEKLNVETKDNKEKLANLAPKITDCVDKLVSFGNENARISCILINSRNIRT